MKIYALLITALLLSVTITYSQSILNGDFSSAGSGALNFSYTKKQYTKFWAGEKEMQAPNEGLNQSIFSIYGRYAISDHIEVVANIPYIHNTSKNDVVDDKAIQDLSLFVKGKIYEFQGFTTGLGLGTNVATGYEPKSLYSLGNGATSFDGLLLLHYKTTFGISLDIQGGYSIKTKEVPNATLFSSKLAFAHAHFYLSALYGLQRSADGLDIGGPGFSAPSDFPNTMVNYDQLLSSLYLPINKSFGVTGHYGMVINGRNIGKYDYFSLGISTNW